MGRKMVQENLFEVTEIFFKGVLLKIKYKVKELIDEQTEENIWENGEIVKCMEEECLVGQMEGSMKDNM